MADANICSRISGHIHVMEIGLWEPAAPTAEIIIVVSNVPASQCFEWTECII